MIERNDKSESTPDAVMTAFEEAAQSAIDRARLTKTFVITNRNGKVVRLTPDEAQAEFNREVNERTRNG